MSVVVTLIIVLANKRLMTYKPQVDLFINNSMLISLVNDLVPCWPNTVTRRNSISHNTCWLHYSYYTNMIIVISVQHFWNILSQRFSIFITCDDFSDPVDHFQWWTKWINLWLSRFHRWFEPGIFDRRTKFAISKQTKRHNERGQWKIRLHRSSVWRCKPISTVEFLVSFHLSS